jgi:hypothetical protein
MRRWFCAFTTALILGALSQTVPALTVTPLDDSLVAVQISTAGATREDALRQARERAVLGTAGRVLLDSQLIRADELLQKYLTNYAANFVKAVEVQSEQFRGGENVLTSRVFVNYAALVSDLEEKRFLYTPAFKPMFAVFMQEQLDGNRLPQEVARPLLRNALEVVGLKAYGGTIGTPPTSVDVATDADLLREAVIAAERRNVELIVTGTTNTTLREQRQVYYETFYFYDCEMSVQLVRVDTGEVLHQTTTTAAASNRDRAEAVRLAIERAAELTANELEEKYQHFWPRVVQSGSDFEVLLTGANDELIRIVTQHLSKVSIDAEISLKKRFDSSAVLTVRSSASRQSIIEALRGCPYPNLTIVREVGQKKFEVQVAG